MSEKENNLEKILKDLELDEVLTSVKSDGDRSTENFYERPLEPPKRRNSLSEEQNKTTEKITDKSEKSQKKNNNKKKKPSDAKDKKTKGKKKKRKKAGLKNFFAFLKSKTKAVPPKAKRIILIILAVILAAVIGTVAVLHAKTAYLKPYETKYGITFPKGIAEDMCDAYGSDQSTVGSISVGDGDRIILSETLNALQSHTDYGTKLDSEQQFKAVSVTQDSTNIESEYFTADAYTNSSQKVSVSDLYGKENTYQVVAAFYVNTNSLDDNGYVFPYNLYGDLTEESFDEYEDKIYSRALYHTEYDLNYTDSFLTVSTQSKVYDYCNFVILCKKTDPDFEKITGTTPNERIHYPQKWYDDNDEQNPYWLASKWHPTVYTDKKHTKTKQLIL